MNQDPALHPTVARVTARIAERSRGPRAVPAAHGRGARQRAGADPPELRQPRPRLRRRVTSEAAAGAIAPVRDGDAIRLDAQAGSLDVLVDDAQCHSHSVDLPPAAARHSGMGRESFALMRAQAGTAERGACRLFVPHREPACAA